MTGRRLRGLGLAVLLLAACGRGAAPGAATPGPGSADAQAQRKATASWDGFVPGVPIQIGHAVKASELSPTERAYGMAPRQAKGLLYRQGVVVLENGDRLVRAIDDSGLACTLDAGDRRVAALRAGDIVFATSLCVGRVLSAERTRAGVRAILGPVQLTELIEQGNFEYEQPLDLSSMARISVPDYPGAPNASILRRPGAPTTAQRTTAQPRADDDANAATMPWASSPAPRWMDAAWHPVAAGAPLPGAPGTRLPDAAGFGEAARDPPPASVDLVNGMRMYPCASDCGGLGLKLYQEKGGVQVWVNAVFRLQKPVLVFHMAIDRNARINAHLELRGGAGFTTVFDAIARRDLRANIKETGIVPVALAVPLGGMGVPLTARFTQSFRLETAFSARTSALHAKGDLAATGAVLMDYRNGAWHIPPVRVTLKNNLAEAVGGVSMGINALVFAINQRLLVGVGALGFAAGPYVDLRSDIAALKGASEALPCRMGKFGMSLGGGIGYSIPRVVAKVINFFLGLVHVKPVPASSYLVRLRQRIPLVNLEQSVPAGCSGVPTQGA